MGWESRSFSAMRIRLVLLLVESAESPPSQDHPAKTL